MAQLCQFDVGSNLDILLVQRNAVGKLVPVILDELDDVVKFVFIFKSGVRKEFIGFIIDGSIGLVRYTTLLNDIEEFGPTKMQLQITRAVPSQDICTRIVIFRITKKL